MISIVLSQGVLVKSEVTPKLGIRISLSIKISVEITS